MHFFSFVFLGQRARASACRAAAMFSLCFACGIAAGAPLIVAHRGGTGDEPENTLTAIQSSLRNKADVIWMTVQGSGDGVPVLYRPADVSALSDGKGPVNSMTLAQLQQLNVGYQFSRTDGGAAVFPYREKPLRMPTLQQALRAVPPSVSVVIDLKQLPAAPLVAAVARVLDDEQAWGRVHIYSTEAEILRLMASYPQASLFETRDATRMRLSEVALSGNCANPPAPGTWVGIELERTVTVVEKFTLGEGRSEVRARWWTPAAVACFKSSPNVKIVVFGIDSVDAYAAAAKLGVDAVMTDSPIKMQAIKQKVAAPGTTAP